MTRRDLLFAAPVLTAAHAAGEELPMVKAKRKPADEWKLYPTRTVRHLAGFQPGAKKVEADRFGGRRDRRVPATGFFRALKQQDRWWLADPEGCLFLKTGIVSLTAGSSRNARAALAEQFGTDEKWMAATIRLLRQYGFNSAGAWSREDLLRSASDRLVYTRMWNFSSSFGKQMKLTFQQPGHAGYAGDCIPVFHPEFDRFCDEYAKALAETKSDPWLLGHFSDNELPAPADLLDKALKLNAGNAALAPTVAHAREWLAKRKGADSADLDDADREAFREHVFDRYFQVTTSAIRKYDPNHLCLGSRLHGVSLRSPGVLRAAGRHLDVIAMNVYGHWTPAADMLDLWRKEAGKPVVVTEFYAKGDDAGFPNTSGAGWIVPTQKDRALFYQSFVLGMLESKMCVGWDWFKYMDNDPEDLSTDPSNRDSNKGIVTIRFQPYRAALEGMAELNGNVYAIADYFDRV